MSQVYSTMSKVIKVERKVNGVVINSYGRALSKGLIKPAVKTKPFSGLRRNTKTGSTSWRA